MRPGRCLPTCWWACAFVVAGSLLGTTPAAADLSEFGYRDVELLPGPFRDARDRNAAYLLSLEPDRLLHNVLLYAGLEPKGEIYGGWESAGIAGHTLGHYLTALSQQFAATGEARWRERIDYIVAEMARAQTAYGDGYVGALPPLERQTLRDLEDGKVEVGSAFNFENGAWVPWYTQHKILAGLRDAWVEGGNTQARTVALGLADWVDRVTRGLDDARLQTMLEVEHGGMREVLVDLYALTGEERYRDAADRFRHRAVLEPLLAGNDELAGRHANTQIPKITGSARNYEVTGDGDDRHIAENFWQLVTGEHSWVIGGNSEKEHFFPPADAPQHLTPATAESCNTYNMLKLTEHLFLWEARVEYADYYERALYNQILASQEPARGMFAYFLALEPGFFKTWSRPFESFWCCVGSGMENHTKYGHAIYFHGDDELFVNLFIPSRLTWAAGEMVLEQRTDYPVADSTELVIVEAAGRPLALRIRVPGWAAAPLEIRVNDELADLSARPGHYATIRRAWRTGDRVTVRIPMALRTEPLRGTDGRVAILFGPAVLAGDLGPVERTDTFPYAHDQWDNFEAAAAPVPALLADPAKIGESVRRVSDDDLRFEARGLLGEREVRLDLRPFADIHYNHYNVYWTVQDGAD